MAFSHLVAPGPLSPSTPLALAFRLNRGASVSYYSRREFLKAGLAAGGLAVTGSLAMSAARQTATDWVTLGKSGVKVTRLAFGTGSFSGQVQRDLGQATWAYEASALRIRPRHSAAQTAESLRRHAQNARCAYGASHASTYLRYVEGHYAGKA